MPTTIRRFTPDDLLSFNNVNLDVLTETARAFFAARRSCLTPAQYGLPFYLQYLAKWPEYFAFAEGPGGACQGYSAAVLPALRLLSLTPDSHGQSGGHRRGLARPRDCCDGASLFGFLLPCRQRNAGCARVPTPRTGAEADGAAGRDEHQKASVALLKLRPPDVSVCFLF